MISDYEVWHTAVAMIMRYGTDAPLQAGERSDRLTANGEIDESEIWQRILAAIENCKLRRRRRGR